MVRASLFFAEWCAEVSYATIVVHEGFLGFALLVGQALSRVQFICDIIKESHSVQTGCQA